MQGLVGDDSESTAILHSLADRYVELGRAEITVRLLRRATAQLNAPASCAHLDAMLLASLALGHALASEGDVEEAIAEFQRAALFKLPLGYSTGAEALLNNIKATRKAAASAAGDLLAKFGRDSEVHSLRNSTAAIE